MRLLWSLYLACLIGGMVAADDPVPTVTTLPQDGFNLVISEPLAPEHLLLDVTPPHRGWFAGAFTGLPVGVPVTLGFSLDEPAASTTATTLSHWQGLRPVMTYADPTRYDAYAWYTKDDQGRWLSGDPLKPAAERVAGTGPVPAQSAIPPHLAGPFLADDGQSWSPWRELDQAEVLANVNIFRLRQTFAAPQAAVAMRVPYTDTYLQAFLARLQAANRPGVFVDELGTTPGGRSLQVVRITDPEDPAADQHAMVLMAREHGTEPASSWAVHGALLALLADTPQAAALRAHRTWLLLPILDPDGSAGSTFDRLTEAFTVNPDGTPPEVLAYRRYFADFIANGGQLDAAVTLHNVVANECPQVMCPFLDLAPNRQAQAKRFNGAWFARLRQHGYQTADPERVWSYGFLLFRLYGRLTANYHALGLAFEVNDRYPTSRLSLPRLQGIGGLLVAQLAAWQDSDDGRQWHQATAAHLARFRAERQTYMTQHGRRRETLTLHEIVTLGY